MTTHWTETDMPDSQLGCGPVVPISEVNLKLYPLLGRAVQLDTTGYLGQWQELNRNATIPHCIAKVESSGALDNLRRLTGKAMPEYSGMQFADTDVYKTLEAVSWQLQSKPDPALHEYLDSTTALLEEVQDEDGYLDSWFQGVRPAERWRNLQMGHEMYCAGHLIQAGIAAARGIGTTRLLDVARRFADLLVRRFGEQGQEGVGGHPIIEMALVELFRLTHERSYLELARRMIDLRGTGLLGSEPYGAQYYLDHARVCDVVEVTGHAVRQLYLASGVVDVFLEEGDISLFQAMERIWQDAFTKKTYITGGQGSRHLGESFGDAYELPPDRAYSETCAGIASFMWNWRMLLATGQSRYADEMERALYNVIAASVSVDGDHFFYTNPLQLRPDHAGSTEDTSSGRSTWFKVPCCPPNLARLIASLQHYVGTFNNEGVQLHLFGQGTVQAQTPFGKIKFKIETRYPWDGHIQILVEEGAGSWTLSIRKPSWCDELRLDVDGIAQDAGGNLQGYVRIRRKWQPGTRVTLDFSMPVRLIRAHPRVDAVRGCGALMRGPVVYCVEAGDTSPGNALDDLRLDPAKLPTVSSHTKVDIAPITIEGPIHVLEVPKDEPLYQSQVDRQLQGVVREGRMVAIPYYRWANRGSQAMRVWLPLLESD
jgi:DUF1680 family protein